MSASHEPSSSVTFNVTTYVPFWLNWYVGVASFAAIIVPLSNVHAYVEIASGVLVEFVPFS